MRIAEHLISEWGLRKERNMEKNADSPSVEVSSKRPFQNLLRSRIIAVFGAAILIVLIS